MDFMKAFDKVPHNRLIHKIESFGINKSITSWISDFLHNRMQRVIINEERSDWKAVTSGIPQGSVLGPILFVMYVNDMPKKISSDIYLFADDAKVYRSIESDADYKKICLLYKDGVTSGN